MRCPRRFSTIPSQDLPPTRKCPFCCGWGAALRPIRHSVTERRNDRAKLRIWFLLLALPGFGAGFGSCVSARINVVDERTALENQILGGYQELDRDLQLVASVRAADGSSPAGRTSAFSELRARAVRARQTQQLNRDDIDELKHLGCLGEASDGLLATRPCEAISDSSVPERTKRVIEAENAARKLIVEFVVATSPDLSQADLPQIVRAYTRLQQEQSKSGEWIQDSSGQWLRK